MTHSGELFDGSGRFGVWEQTLTGRVLHAFDDEDLAMQCAVRLSSQVTLLDADASFLPKGGTGDLLGVLACKGKSERITVTLTRNQAENLLFAASNVLGHEDASRAAFASRRDWIAAEFRDLLLSLASSANGSDEPHGRQPAK